MQSLQLFFLSCPAKQGQIKHVSFCFALLDLGFDESIVSNFNNSLRGF